MNKTELIRKPYWLKIKKLPAAGEYSYIKSYLKKNNLHTICESGNCPNIGECWAAKTATFMILGNICTRNCKFCSVEKGRPHEVDIEEPIKIARVISDLKLHHCVLTSVTRDDLSDGGASIWAETVIKIRDLSPETSIETLIPDFEGDLEAIDKVINSRPDIISHNIETVRRLTPLIRIKASYDLSLSVIERISVSGIRSKSGLMLGLGENEEEILSAINDLYNAGCRILTIGQYLQPTKENFPVARYVDPEEFEKLKSFSEKTGFDFVESGPFVRSSYHAEKHIK